MTAQPTKPAKADQSPEAALLAANAALDTIRTQLSEAGQTLANLDAEREAKVKVAFTEPCGKVALEEVTTRHTKAVRLVEDLESAYRAAGETIEECERAVEVERQREARAALLAIGRKYAEQFEAFGKSAAAMSAILDALAATQREAKQMSANVDGSIRALEHHFDTNNISIAATLANLIPPSLETIVRNIQAGVGAALRRDDDGKRKVLEFWESTFAEC